MKPARLTKPVTLDLADGELEAIDPTDRCVACGHLDSLHYGDERTCMVGDCPCQQ